MENIRIRDRKKSDTGSGMFIPDPKLKAKIFKKIEAYLLTGIVSRNEY
jgi:hypothetical protein